MVLICSLSSRVLASRLHITYGRDQLKVMIWVKVPGLCSPLMILFHFGSGVAKSTVCCCFASRTEPVSEQICLLFSWAQLFSMKHTCFSLSHIMKMEVFKMVKGWKYYGNSPAKQGVGLCCCVYTETKKVTLCSLFCLFIYLFNSGNEVIQLALFGGTEGAWVIVGGNLFPVGTAVGEEKDV